MANEKKHAVVAVNHDTNKVRMFEEKNTYANCEAIVNIATMRRGLDEEFYAIVAAGSHKDGDKYDSSKVSEPAADDERCIPREARGL